MLVGRQGLLIWALGLFVPSRTSSSVRNCASFPRQPVLGGDKSLTRPPLAVCDTLADAPTSLGITVGCRPPVPARHQISNQRRRSNRKRDPSPLAAILAALSWPSYPSRHLVRLVPSGLQFPTLSDSRRPRRPFSTRFYADQTFALMRTTFSSSLLQVTNAIPSASRS